MSNTEPQTSLMAQVDRGSLGLIQELFRAAARRVRTRLVNRINDDVAVRYGTVETVSLGRALERLHQQEGGAFATFHLEPSGLPCVVVIQGPLLYRMVGIMLGEDPSREAPLYHWRPLTAVDLNIARRLTQDVLLAIQESCALPQVPDLVFEGVTGNPRVRCPLPMASTVVEASLDFGPPERPYGLLSVIVPGQAAGVLWPSRTNKIRADHAPTNEGIGRVLPVPVTVVAELARVTMPIQRVRQLSVGSLLDLGQLRDVQLRVGDMPVLAAEYGDIDGVRSVKIKRRIGQLMGPQPSQ
jgi:flagellar motor switch protein FliM